MKKFLLLLALFCLFGGSVTVLDCSKSDGGEEEAYEIEEEGEEDIKGETEESKDPIEEAISTFCEEHFKKKTWDENIKNILTQIFENYEEEKDDTKTAAYILPLCKEGTAKDPVDLYKKVVTPTWKLLQEKDQTFYTDEIKKNFLDLLYKIAIDENSNIIIDALDLFTLFKKNNPEGANTILGEKIKSYNPPMVFFKTIQRISPDEKSFLDFIKNLESLYPAWSDFFPKNYLLQKEGSAKNIAVKKLQEMRFKSGASIKTLRSLNQRDKKVINEFGEKCGLYAIYNLLEIEKIIHRNNENFDTVLKDYEYPNPKYILGSDGKAIGELALHNDIFLEWVKKQEGIFPKNTYTKYSEANLISEQNKEIEKEIGKLEKKQKKVIEKYQSQIPKSEKEKSLSDIKTKITEKEFLTLKDLIDRNKGIKDKFTNIELSSDRLGDLLKNIKNKNLNTLDNFVLLTSTALQSLTNKEEIEKLLIKECLSFSLTEDLWISGHFYEKIKKFRESGMPIYLVLLKVGHWFCAVMTCRGMYIANSYENTSYVDYIHLKKLYDYILFGNLPEETKIEVKPPETKKDPLANALALLKAKLLSLAKQLATKN
jgi:hypothetical protein